MDEISPVSHPRRWLESTLVWYILFVALYLLLRFIFQSDWRLISLIDNFAPYLFLLVVIGFVMTLLLRARRLIGLYLLGTVVAVVWLLPPLIPLPQDAEVDGSPLEIITFNVFPNNEQLDTAVDWLGAYAPEIIALQELPEDSSALAPLEAAYPHHEVQGFKGGKAVFSQYPIIEAERIDFINTMAQRVVLDVDGQSVAVYNVHFYIPLNDREADWLILRYDESIRNQEIERLIEMVDAEEMPVIVAGDFNMTEWSPIYRRITQVMTDAYRDGSWGVGATWPAGASEDVQPTYPRLFRLDYIWHSEPIHTEMAIVGAPLGSDHLPVRAELSLP